VVRDAERLDRITARKAQEMGEFIEVNRVEMGKRRLEFLQRGINPPVGPEVIQ
jgi:hypothetical protein